MRILLMGPPGSGKGTQAAFVAADLGIPSISTGDIFRAHVAAGSALGVSAQGYMDAGEYVPDEITNAMVATRLAEPDTECGFLLDGYPRTPEQVERLDEVLVLTAASLDAVVTLDLDIEALVARLLERARTEGRSDDTEPVIRRRQEVYADQTAPLIAEYDARGLVLRVDGAGTVQDVRARVSEVLAERRAAMDAPATAPGAALTSVANPIRTRNL
jgi:adenylate kinase